MACTVRMKNISVLHLLVRDPSQLSSFTAKNSQQQAYGLSKFAEVRFYSESDRDFVFTEARFLHDKLSFQVTMVVLKSSSQVLMAVLLAHTPLQKVRKLCRTVRLPKRRPQLNLG